MQTTVVWALLMVIGSKDSYSPSLFEHEFNNRQACVQMLASMEKQRSDVSGKCVADTRETFSYELRTSTITLK